MATIASLVVDISANTASIDRGVADLHSKFDNLDGVVGNFAAGLVSAFTATAVVEGIRRMVTGALNYADSLSNLSAATSITVSGLQDLENIGIDTGTSVETMAKAVEMLHRKLDDPAARQAVEQMGLNYQRIREMQPEEQFLEIAKNVAKIEDPVERANAGAALFGKTWDSISAALQGDVEKHLTAVHKLSEEEISALDSLGDAWDEALLGAKRYSAQLVLLATSPASSSLLKSGLAGGIFDTSMDKLPNAPAAPKLTVANPLAAMQLPDLAGKLNGLTTLKEELDRATKSVSDHEAASKKAAAAHERLIESFANLRYGVIATTGPTLGLNKTYVEYGSVVNGTIQGTEALTLSLSGAGIETDLFGNAIQAHLLPSLGGMNKTFDEGQTKTVTWQDNLKVLSQSFADLGAVGGTALNAVSRGIGVMITGFNVAMDGISSLKDGLKSLKAGDTLSGIAGIASGIGGIVGAAQAAIGAVKALWNWARGGEEGTQVNPARDAWFNAHGGLTGVNEAAQGATGNVDLTAAIFAADTMAEFNAAIEAWSSATGGSTGGLVSSSGIQHFAGGGMVGTDTVRAMLTPGEMVLTTSQQRAVGALMGNGGSGGAAMVRELKSLRDEIVAGQRALARQFRLLPQMLTIATADAANLR